MDLPTSTAATNIERGSWILVQLAPSAIPVDQLNASPLPELREFRPDPPNSVQQHDDDSAVVGALSAECGPLCLGASDVSSISHDWFVGLCKSSVLAIYGPNHFFLSTSFDMQILLCPR